MCLVVTKITSLHVEVYDCLFVCGISTSCQLITDYSFQTASNFADLFALCLMPQGP